MDDQARINEEIRADLRAKDGILTAITEALAAMSEADLETVTRQAAVERLVLTLLAMTAVRQADPLNYLDQVRATAQDPLGEGLQGVGDHLERLLSKAQAGVIKAQKKRGGVQ